MYRPPVEEYVRSQLSPNVLNVIVVHPASVVGVKTAVSPPAPSAT